MKLRYLVIFQLIFIMVCSCGKSTDDEQKEEEQTCSTCSDDNSINLADDSYDDGSENRHGSDDNDSGDDDSGDDDSGDDDSGDDDSDDDDSDDDDSDDDDSDDDDSDACDEDGSTGNTIVVAPSGAQYSSIQAAVNAANPCDTVLVRAGIYKESVTFSRGGSAAGGYITVKGEPGTIIDGGNNNEVGIHIAGKSYIKIIGMTIRNITSGDTPMGIHVEGASTHIELRNNLVHNIECTGSSDESNAHGIAIYGNSSTPISNIIIDGNEIRDCKLGQSESMVLNGNVTDFIVSKNKVHDNDNIGIDFIGYEENDDVPDSLNSARNGICVDNVVYNISSANNPTYGGERSADGIYVDGGHDIIIERNTVDNCDVGIEAASEHKGKSTSNIIIRNNFVSRSYQGNIQMGGYDASVGKATNITVVNNTTYGGGSGEVFIQYNTNTVSIKNNIFYAASGEEYIVNDGANNTNISVNNNLYYGASTSSSGSFNDSNSIFANPQLVNTYHDMHIKPGSRAINAGVSLSADTAGEYDIDGNPRVQGGTINIGAHEK